MDTQHFNHLVRPVNGNWGVEPTPPGAKPQTFALAEVELGAGRTFKTIVSLEDHSDTRISGNNRRGVIYIK